MKLKMFSIYDGKAQAYGSPFFLPAVGLAIRAFTDLVNDGKSVPGKYPADFYLFELGEYDDSDASVVMKSPPLNLGIGSAFVREAANGGKVVELPVDPVSTARRVTLEQANLNSK